MKLFVLLALLGVGAYSLPTDTTDTTDKPTTKFPKKYDPSIHSEDALKKSPLKTSYSSYQPSQEMDVMKPPPSDYEEFLYLNPPPKDTYTDPEGIPYTGIVVPVELLAEISQSYTGYEDQNPGDRMEMAIPHPWPYAFVEEPQDPDSLSPLQPPAEEKKPEERSSSYTN